MPGRAAAPIIAAMEIAFTKMQGAGNDFVVHWDGGSGTGFDHISTGGGASIELMAGVKLPGTEALMDV